MKLIASLLSVSGTNTGAPSGFVMKSFILSFPSFPSAFSACATLINFFV